MYLHVLKRPKHENKLFFVAVESGEHRCEQEAQDDIIDSGQDEGATFDKTTFGVGLGKDKTYEKFSDIKV